MQVFRSLLHDTVANERSHFPVLSGNSVVAIAMRRMVDLAASVVDPLFISGPIGSGKSAIAHAVHLQSNMPNDAFATFDCRSISNTDKDKIFATGLQWPGGQFSGTVFLENIEMLQSELQHALREWLNWNVQQDRRIRLIAASNVRFEQLRFDESFDRGLLDQFEKLIIPAQPLSRRQKDIRPLMIALWTNSHAGLPPCMSRAAWQLLEDRDWPGNFVELQRVARLLSIACGGKSLGAPQLARLLSLAAVRQMSVLEEVTGGEPLACGSYDLEQHLALEEAVMLVAALERCEWQVERAARYTGIDPVSFRRKMQTHDIAAQILPN